MATVACPECGLPRVESELGVKLCPVCHAVPITTSTPARRAKPADADPTDGLPADASELYGPNAPAPTHAPGAQVRALGAALFFCGAFVGMCGVLGVQALDGAKAEKNGDPTEVAVKPEEPPALPNRPTEPPKPRGPAVAPMPHEPSAQLAESGPALAPAPRPVLPPPPPWRVTTIDVGPNPPDVFTLPFPLKTGEHVILKGKVKTLKVYMLDAGAILDASGLEATTVTISGKIDNKSTLKLNVPNGTVHFSGKVDNRSVIEINAPGGEVKFTSITTGTKEGSKIDNGSTVVITARVVEFKGDINGTDTKVGVTLTRNAWLKVGSVSGKAVVEYKSQAAGWSPPDVIVGTVAPTATFRKAGE